MRVTRIRILALLAATILMLAFMAPAADASTSDLYTAAQKARQELARDKKAQDLRHNWLNVIKRYQAVIDRDPGGKLAAESWLAQGDLYMGLYTKSRSSEDLEKGLDCFRQLTKRFPQQNLAAQAQLRIGKVYADYNRDMDRAYVEYLKVELNHPGAREEVAEARKRMAKISGPAPSEPPEPETPPKAAAKPVAEEKPAAEASAQPSGNGKALVQGMRYWANPTYSRIAIDLTGEVGFRDHLLRPDKTNNKPMRLYLDLGPAKMAPDAREELPISDGLLNGARIGQHDQDTVRVVLDIQEIYNYRIFSLTNPSRIVIDVTGRQKEKPEAVASAAKPETAKPETAKPGETASVKLPLTDLRAAAEKRPKLPRGPAHVPVDQSSLARQLGLGISRVVIDPGHGGKDHGATGITGLPEKDLTLELALMLADKIRKQLGLDVVLTRTKDVFIPLEERTAIANTKGADLFISIHANAHRDAKITGLETYFLNLATDEEAMRVAALENAATRKKMSDLQVILNDLLLNSKITESGRLAGRVHRAMVGKLRNHYKDIRDLGVKQAPFYVLIGANMPSILVEIGFISSKSEETRLKSKKYKERLTDGLVEGVKAYAETIKKAG